MQAIKCRILFVEDHEDTRELLALVLEQSAYKVITASNIADALTLVQTEKFDLFVLDSLLSDGTGVELCKRIREINHSTPILFYSALAYEKDKNEAFSSGAQRYLVKPVSIPLLCQTVAELVPAACQSDNEVPGRKVFHQVEAQIGTLAVLGSKESRTVAPKILADKPVGQSVRIRARQSDPLKTTSGQTAA